MITCLIFDIGGEINLLMLKIEKEWSFSEFFKNSIYEQNCKNKIFD